MNAQYLPSSDLSSANWDQLRQMAEAETGMDLAGSRFPRLQEAVRKLLPAQSSSAELQRVMSQPDTRTRFLERLTVQLTVGESFFFRNEHHFRTLRETVIPAIVRDNADRRELRIWTAGCATGEEPYSLAILLDQVLGAQSHWQISILGTDLNPEFLERARQARYRQWSFRQTNIHQDRNYFTQEGDLFCLVPRVRSCVRFAYLNLVKDVYPSPLTGTLGLDLILFRNVAIYLKPEVTRAILQRFHQALRPGGWLLLGETELNLMPTEGFEVRRFDQATFHQKATDRLSSTQPLSPPTVPVLATILPNSGAGIPTVPILPDWVPLPTPRSRRLDRPRPATTTARSSLAATATSETSTCDRIERCHSHRDFAEAERIIDRIPALADRAATRLRYLRCSWHPPRLREHGGCWTCVSRRSRCWSKCSSSGRVLPKRREISPPLSRRTAGPCTSTAIVRSRISIWPWCYNRKATRGERSAACEPPCGWSRRWHHTRSSSMVKASVMAGSKK